MKHFKLFEQFVKDEHTDEVNESATEIALGIVGGVAGLWALSGATQILSGITRALGRSTVDAIESAVKKSAKKKKSEFISGITSKFDGDTELQNMYASLPPYSDKTKKERTKKLAEIAEYIKSKLSSDELEYFTDISSMLRTGDIRESAIKESKAPEWVVGKTYQDGKVKKVDQLAKDKVKVTFTTGDAYVYQIDRYNPENWVQVDEAAVNEAATDLQSYVKKASEKCFAGGGNGENLLGYGLPEAAGQIDAYLKGPRNEDWIYTDKTATAFIKFIDTMVEEEIKNNQADI